MDFPSGDQTMGDDGGPGGKLEGNDQVPLVNRLGSPPSAGTNHKCTGRVASWMVKSSLPTLNAVRNFASPLSSGFGSVMANAMLAPSGLQANCSTPSLPLVSCSESPPAIGIT
jgi:hypothetical protein